jgi:hypothetical protein
VGNGALGANTTASNNTAVGSNCLAGNTTGDNCVAIGHDVMEGSNGDSNTGVGFEAMKTLTTGDNNTAVGRQCLNSITTGRFNTALGTSGQGVTTGENNTFLGYNAGSASSPSGNITTGNNNFVLGDDYIANLYCNDTSISSSDARDKTDIEDFKYGLSWITELRPVTYRWDKRSWYTDDPDTKGTPDGSKKRDRIHVGFLAQEAIEVEKKFGYADKKDNMLIVNQDEDEKDPSYGYKYERLVPVLVNAIKELSSENDALKARLDAAGL